MKQSIQQTLVQQLSERLRKHKTCHVCSAGGLDPLTVRKVRNMVNIGTVKIETLERITDALDAIEGVHS